MLLGNRAYAVLKICAVLQFCSSNPQRICNILLLPAHKNMNAKV